MIADQDQGLRKYVVFVGIPSFFVTWFGYLIFSALHVPVEAKVGVSVRLTVLARTAVKDFYKSNGIITKILHWPLEKKEPNVMTYLKERKIDLVINIPKSFEEEELENDYLIRRKAVDFNIPLLTNPQNTKLFIESIAKLKMEDLEIKDWEGYD